MEMAGEPLSMEEGTALVAETLEGLSRLGNHWGGDSWWGMGSHSNGRKLSRLSGLLGKQEDGFQHTWEQHVS
jgi:hypothetical protein